MARTGAESAGSTKATVSTAAAQVIGINITSLNPPNGLMQNAIGTASGYFAPMARNSLERLCPTGTADQRVGIHPALPAELGANSDSNEDHYTLANAPVLSGFELNAEGQPAQYDFTAQNILWRA